MTPRQADFQQSPIQQDDGIARSVGPLEGSDIQEATGERPTRAAVFVIHGMGQQIPFEALDQTASGLIRASTLLFRIPLLFQPELERADGAISQALRQEFAKHKIDLADSLRIEAMKVGETWKISEVNGTDPQSFIVIKEHRRLTIYTVPPEIQANTVQLGKQKLPRAEFEIVAADGKPMEVHVYEGYWAPITEGNVTLRDVTSFLWDAGLNGITNRGDDFSRFMFGKLQSFPIPPTAHIAVAVALLVFLSLILTITLFSIVAVIHLFQLPRVGDWPSTLLLNQLLIMVSLYILCVGAFGVPLWLVYQCRAWIQRSRLHIIWRLLNTVLWWMFWGCILVTIVIGVSMFVFSIADFFREVTTDEQLGKLQVIYIWVAWGFLLFVSWQLRGVLIQSMGDVIAYVSSHKLDRFLDIRAKIKECVCEYARAIYAHRDEHGQLYYDQIGIIGHSLGSVIAYDTVNAMLYQDGLDDHIMKVVERTKVLVTFGSPLDKTAFVFSRQGKHTSATREALAASVQPLILDYKKYRKMKWINIYAARDIIGNALRYYDAPEGDDQPAANPIRNIEDPDAVIPLLAHVEYWDTPTMFREFYRAFTA